MKGSVSYDRNDRLQIFVSLENAAQGKQFFDRVIEKTALVIKAHPNSSIADNALLLMGRAYYYQREFAAAERKFKEVISNYTDSDVLDAATFWYGRCLAQQQQTLQAKEVLGSVIASPRTSAAVRADAHFALAELAIRDEVFQEAIKHIELGLPLAVDIEQKARAAFVLARIYDQLGDFKSAATYYQAVLKLNPDFDLQYAALLSYALDLRKQKEYEAAERVLLRILGDDKYLDKFPEVRYELAQCYELQDRLGKALDLYIEIIRRHKKTEFSARSYLRLGLIKQEISRDYAAALAFYDSAKVEFSQGEVGKLIEGSVKRMEKILKLYESRSALDSTLRLGIVQGDRRTERKRIDTTALRERRTMQRTRRDYRRSVFLELGGIESFSDSAEVRTTIKRQKITFEAARDSATYLRYKLDYLDYSAEIANFYQMILPIADSAKAWYRITLAYIDDSLHTFPDSLQKRLYAQKAPLLYALAEVYRAEAQRAQQDSLYKLILEKFPRSKYAERIREYFGLPPLVEETADDQRLYVLALSKLEEGEKTLALRTLDSLMHVFPHSALYPKMLLLKGFIFEKQALRDSAISAYSALVKKFPNSEEARSVQAKLEVVQQLKATKSDSLSSQVRSNNDTLTTDSMNAEHTDTTLALPRAKLTDKKDSLLASPYSRRNEKNDTTLLRSRSKRTILRDTSNIK